MSKTPTAESILLDKLALAKVVQRNQPYVWKALQDCMIEFAKLHVEKAKEAAYQAACKWSADEDGFVVTDSESIEKSYPLDNIK